MYEKTENKISKFLDSATYKYKIPKIDSNINKNTVTQGVVFNFLGIS